MKEEFPPTATCLCRAIPGVELTASEMGTSQHSDTQGIIADSAIEAVHPVLKEHLALGRYHIIMVAPYADPVMNPKIQTNPKRWQRLM